MRLDRILVNAEFTEIFPNREVQYFFRQGSDHAPLHVICQIGEDNITKPFRFLISGVSIKISETLLNRIGSLIL